MNKPTLTLAEAAEVLNVHENTVAAMLADCTLPAAKVGRVWVLLSIDVLNYVTRLVNEQTAERMHGRAGGAPGRHHKRVAKSDARKLA